MEALESPTRLVTDEATQWLASMDEMRDDDATDRAPSPKAAAAGPGFVSPSTDSSPVACSKKRELRRITTPSPKSRRNGPSASSASPRSTFEK